MECVTKTLAIILNACKTIYQYSVDFNESALTNKYTVAAELSDLGFNDQKTQALGRPKCKKHPGYSDLKRVDKNWPLNQAGTMYTKSSVLRTQIFLEKNLFS